MELLLIGLVLTVIAVFVVPLAVLRAGIRRQHCASSLICQPPGFSAAVARRVFGLYVRTPDTADQCGPAHYEPPVIPQRRGGAS